MGEKSNKHFLYQGPDGERHDLTEGFNTKRKNEREGDVEIPKELEHIDFDVLHGIVDEILKRGHIDSVPLNFIAPTDITMESSSGIISDSMADHAMGKVKMYRENIENKAKELNIKEEFIYLHALVHEMAHAASFDEVKLHEGNQTSMRSRVKAFLKPLLKKRIGTRSDVRSGYATKKDVEKYQGLRVTKEQVLDLFNEGVTEMLAQSIVDEYLRRTGYGTPDDREKYQQTQSKIAGGYTEAVDFVNAFIEELAERNEVSAEVTRGAIINGYTNGEDIMSGETGELLTEIFDSELFEKLAKATSSKDMKKLREEYL